MIPLQESLALFRKQWPDYAQKVERGATGHLKHAETVKGEPNLQVIDPEGVHFFHSQDGALREAEKRFELLEIPSGCKTLIQYGVGCGYDYLAAGKWLKQDPDRLMIILEGDFGVIKELFGRALGLQMLSDKQVLIVPIESDVDALRIKFPKGFEIILHLGLSLKYFICFSKYCSQTQQSFCQALKKYIHLRIQDFRWLTAFETHVMKTQFFENPLRNLFHLSEMRNGYALFEKFRGVPVLICAAGPSIEGQLPRLQQLKNRALVFGAGTGMNTLNSFGILPHFGCGIDPNEASESRMLTHTAFTVPYFQTLLFNYKAARLVQGERLFFKGPESHGTMNWMINELGLGEKPLNFHVSTTCACLMLAKEMNGAPIVFLGLDLSYTDQKRYVGEITTHPADKEREMRALKELPKESLIPAVNARGERIFTRIDWINEGAYYSFVAQNNPELRLINATSEGLAIPGIEHQNLDEIERRELTISYDLDNWVHAEVMGSNALSIQRNTVSGLIKTWEASLKKGSALILEMMDELLNLDEGMKEIPDQLGSGNYHQLKKELEKEPIYQHLVRGAELSYQKSRIREYIALQFHAHLLEKQDRYNRTLLMELFCLKFLFKEISLQLSIIENSDLSEERQTEHLGKKLPRRGRQPENNYSFDGKTLTISDGELGVDFHDAFSPPLIGQKLVNIEQESQRVHAAFEDGIPDGECQLLSKEGWIKGKWYYKRGMLHGPSAFFSKQGSVLAQGWFFNNKKEGKNWQYYPSGALYSIQRFKNDLLEGVQEYFFEEGAVRSKLTYSGGVLNGMVELFFPNGVMSRRLAFLNGKRHGYEQFWSDKQVLLMESEFREGKPVGIARKWYPTGQIWMEKKMIDEEGSFDVKEWDPEGKLMVDKVYLPDTLGQGLLESQEMLSASIQQLKKSIKGLINDQNK